jgi:hypothetical protein
MAAKAPGQQQQQQHASRRPAFELELQAIEDYRRFAACTIQRYYRGWIVRLHRARQVGYDRPHTPHSTLHASASTNKSASSHAPYC